MENKVWLSADLHFGHAKIMEFAGRPYNSVEEMDEGLIAEWNSRVSKHDIVFVLGDFSFHDIETTKKILSRLAGDKYLILGNHDKSGSQCGGYFKNIWERKDMRFKASVYPFLTEDFRLQMGHPPEVSWYGKPYGVCHIHGHCHGRLDKYNIDSKELRVDVGWDSKLGNGSLVSLEKLYKHFDKIAKSAGEYTISKYGIEFVNKNKEF